MSPKADSTQWRDLYHEVVTSGLCTGCTACIVACPFHVLGYEDDMPVQLQEGGPDACTHGDRGCSLCTLRVSALPRVGVRDRRSLFGRARRPEELIGLPRHLSWRGVAPEALAAGQDGGVVSALLMWGLATADRRRLHVGAVGRATVGRRADRRHRRGGRLATAGQPLHLQRQPARVAEGRRAGAVEGRARGDGLPVLGDGRDGGPAREQVAQEDRMDLRTALLEVVHATTD